MIILEQWRKATKELFESSFSEVNKVGKSWLEQNCLVFISFWNSPEIKHDSNQEGMHKPVFYTFGYFQGQSQNLANLSESPLIPLAPLVGLSVKPLVRLTEQFCLVSLTPKKT